MSFWSGQRVLVAGGAGFIGSHAAEMLVRKGAAVKVIDSLENGSLSNLGTISKDIEFVAGDLRDLALARKVSRNQRIVLNLAAKVGGISFNQEHPGTMFRDNVLINTNVLEAARLNNAERVLVVSSACVYPRYCTVPTPESEGFKDQPEPTNYGYGWAKRMAEIQASAYAQEFGLKIAVARPYNTYGPRDHFDPETSHVIPALIKRVFDGEDPLVVWGDGEQSRAFIFVRDVARGLLDAAERYPQCDPVNLGTDREVRIKDLVGLIVRLSGTEPELVFDASRPAGQPRRNCDTRKAREKFGFEARVRLEEGLRETIQWYKNEFGK